MVNIDYIMDLLDWNKSAQEQEIGIQLARSVRCINVFYSQGLLMEKMFGITAQRYYLRKRMKS